MYIQLCYSCSLMSVTFLQILPFGLSSVCFFSCFPLMSKLLSLLSSSARALASPETCHTPSAGVPPVNACKMCENMSWNGLVFLYVCRLKIASFFSGWTRELRLCFRHLALPRHAATAFTSSGQRSRGQRPLWGSGMAGWRVLTSSLLMCGLVCFIWHVALKELACRLLVLWV